MKQFLSALGMVIVGACWTDAALASPIAFHFGGSVTSVDPLLTGTFAVGDPISDILTFDPAAVDTDPNPATGRYQYISFQLQFGSYVASSLPGVNSIISVFNQPSFDLFQALSAFSAVGAPVNGLTLVSGATTLLDSTHMVFNSDGFRTSRIWVRLTLQTRRLVSAPLLGTPATAIRTCSKCLGTLRHCL